jgi:hypothetical protein
MHFKKTVVTRKLPKDVPPLYLELLHHPLSTLPYIPLQSSGISIDTNVGSDKYH